ncbi:MAG: cation-translocating P-type ATPase [Phycisphaerales bacterium]|nr:cation-translocating P-type ATPase [Phycisphaerales bacterium]
MQGADAHLDMQLLTGESRPVRVAAGDQVHAGVRTTSAPVRVRVTAAGDATRAAAIARMVEEAAGRRPPVVEFANRIAGWFLVAVIAVTAATGVAWWFIDPVRMPGIVIAMLVVTCPCALGLATPLTMVAALGKAARAGILVRGGEVIERLASPGTLVLDKTGTVTEGSMRVMRVEGDAAALARAVALESRSVHPVAQAIVEWGRESGGPGAEFARMHHVSCVREVAGRGIEGVVDGAMVAVGSRSFVAGDGGSLERSWSDAADAMEADGLSPVFVRVDGRVCAAVGVGDPVRRDAAALVESLASRGWSVWLCSGDVPTLAERVGEAIGIPAKQAIGGRSPEEKLSFVAARVRLPVVMVGDGVNDLPAMAAADVGIAVRQGAQATVERADVALTGGGLAQVVSLLDGARRTMRTIHVNFAISVGYNVVGAVLAATGTINPLIAAVMMPLSGLTVTAVALRMPRFRAP